MEFALKLEGARRANLNEVERNSKNFSQIVAFDFDPGTTCLANVHKQGAIAFVRDELSPFRDYDKGGFRIV